MSSQEYSKQEQKDYQEFVELFKTKMLTDLADRVDNIEFYPEGYTSNDPEVLKWIVESNQFASKEPAPWLQTDFLVLKKDGQIFQSLPIRVLYETAHDDFDSERENGDSATLIQTGLSDTAKDTIKTLIEGDYDKIRETFMLRPLNYSLHIQELKGCVYKRISDFVLVLYQYLGTTGNNFSSRKVFRHELQSWGVDQEKAMQDAMENSMRLFPPYVYNFKEQHEVNVLTDEFSKEEIEYENIFSGAMVGRKESSILLSTNQTNGAIALFYPGVIEKMMKVMGGSFLAVFRNINDVLIFERTSRMARKTAETASISSRMGEMLSKKVYLCDEKGINVAT